MTAPDARWQIRLPAHEVAGSLADDVAGQFLLEADAEGEVGCRSNANT